MKDIQLVEREHIQDVLKEQESQHTRYFDTTSYSQALTLFDRRDYPGAIEKMQPVMRDAPNSLVVQKP